MRSPLIYVVFICVTGLVSVQSAALCPSGVFTVSCKADPCRMTHCPLHPTARCVSNYCGGCNAEFFDAGGNLLLDCNTH